MNRDTIEKFITEHRVDFDDAIPPLKVWSDINRELDKPILARRKRWHLMRMAAAVVILLLVGGVAGSYLTPRSQNQAAALLEELAPEYAEMARFYQDEISRQAQMVSSSDHSDPSVFNDLEQIDETMRELRQELLEAPKGTEQEIIENLIRSYQAKLAILQRVLERINQMDVENNLNNEISI